MRLGIHRDSQELRSPPPGGFRSSERSRAATRGGARFQGRGSPIEQYELPGDIVDEAKRIMAAAGIDVGGVEYLVDARDREAHFYDVNALFSFVADTPEVVGFDPFVDLVDLILERAGAQAVAA